ncbi:hypothetical protein COP1_038820 [Malus domestica]
MLIFSVLNSIFGAGRIVTISVYAYNFAKTCKKRWGQIDRNRDIEHLWDFYQRYKRRHGVGDIQRQEQRWGQIDRNRDIEHLWDFYQRYKRRHGVGDIQRQEQRWRQSGTFGAYFGEYGSIFLL